MDPRQRAQASGPNRATGERRKRGGIGIGILLGATLALAACGGSGAPPRPTKAQYVKRADAICSEAASQAGPAIKQILPLATSLVSGASGAAHKLAALVGTLHSDAAADLERLEALREPAGAHAAIERFLKPLSTVVGALGSATSTLRGANPVAVIGLLGQVEPTAGQVTSAAHAYGLPACERILGSL